MFSSSLPIQKKKNQTKIWQTWGISLSFKIRAVVELKPHWGLCRKFFYPQLVVFCSRLGGKHGWNRRLIQQQWSGWAFGVGCQRDHQKWVRLWHLCGRFCPCSVWEAAHTKPPQCCYLLDAWYQSLGTGSIIDLTSFKFQQLHKRQSELVRNAKICK